MFHGSDGLTPPYRKYGPTTPGNPATASWYDLPGAVFDSESIGGSTVATVTLSLSDGALGDDTGVDGMIVDVGGPTALASVPASPAAIIWVLGAALGIMGIGLLSRERTPADRER